MVFSNGKKKIGFHLEGDIAFEDNNLTIDTIDEYGDFEYKLSNDKSGKNWDDYYEVFKKAVNAYVNAHFN